MNYEKKEVKVIIISGKARAGKDTTCGFMKKYYDKKGVKSLNIAFASYIKEYAKKISDWDGSDETKPRELLQQLGTSIIREKIDNEFFIKRIIGDIEVYSYFFDVIIISDARFIEEIERLKENFEDVISVNIVRPNYDNGLTENQSNHYTEIGLDNFKDYDYEVINDDTLETLENKIIDLMKVVDEK